MELFGDLVGGLSDFGGKVLKNLFKPLLLFFYMGFTVPILKVAFEFPHVLYQGLTMYLLISIGWKGGEELAELALHSPQQLVQAVGFMVIGFITNFLIGMLAYVILRATTKLRRIDAATVGAYYGSDSAGTFVTCVGVLSALAGGILNEAKKEELKAANLGISRRVVDRVAEIGPDPKKLEEKTTLPKEQIDAAVAVMKKVDARNAAIIATAKSDAIKQANLGLDDVMIEKVVKIGADREKLSELNLNPEQIHAVLAAMARGEAIATAKVDKYGKAAYMPVMLAVMEIPGCLVGLYLISRMRQSGMDRKGNMPGEPGYDPITASAPDATELEDHSPQENGGEDEVISLDNKPRPVAKAASPKRPAIFSKELLHEVFFNPGLFLLFAGILIGFIGELQGVEVVKDDNEVFVNLFHGMLCLFLLEMGMTASRRIKDLKTAGLPFIAFALIAPNVFAVIGMCIAHVYSMALGQPFQIGTYALFAVLCAAASYIAVPAIQRLAIPEASPTLPLAASLGVTFSYNVTVGITVYIYFAECLTSRFPVGT